MAHWPLDSSAQDRLGRWNGTAVGTSPSVDRGGRAGGALFFDGTRSYIDIGQLHPPTAAFSVSFWMKAGVAVTTTGLNGENEIIGDAGGNAGFRVFQQDRRLYFQAQGGGGKTAGVDMTAPDTERWIHVAGVFDGRALLYRNGILVDASAVGSASATGTRSLQIGRDTNISSSYWRGTLDEIQIFSRALSPAEVTALAQP